MTPYPENSLVPLAPQVLCLFWQIPPCWHATLKWWKWCAGKCKWSPTLRYNHRKCENSCGTSSVGLSQQCFAQVVFLPCIWLLKSLIGCFPKASPLCLFYQNLTSWVSDMMLILRVWWILPLDNFFSARVSILIGKASWFWCLSNISYGFSALIIVFPLGPKLSFLLFALLGLLSSIIHSECQKFQFILKWRLICQTDIPNTHLTTVLVKNQRCLIIFSKFSQSVTKKVHVLLL